MLFDEMCLDSVIVKRKPGNAGLVRATFITDQWQNGPLNGLFCLDESTKMIEKAPLCEFGITELKLSNYDDPLLYIARWASVQLVLKPGERIVARVTWEIGAEKNTLYPTIIREPKDGKDTNPGITPSQLVALGQAVGRIGILSIIRPPVAETAPLFPNGIELAKPEEGV